MYIECSLKSLISAYLFCKKVCYWRY